MKDLCTRYNIPTASYGRFTEPAPAGAVEAGCAHRGQADGLPPARVIIAKQSIKRQAVDEMLIGGAFGEAGAEIVVEEFMEGVEASFRARRRQRFLASAQDHKRVGTATQARIPAGWEPIHRRRRSRTKLWTSSWKRSSTHCGEDEGGRQTLSGCSLCGSDADRRRSKAGGIQCPFGDRECQVLMTRLMSDLVPALIAACDGELKDFDLRWFDEAALTVVMASNVSGI